MAFSKIFFTIAGIPAVLVLLPFFIGLEVKQEYINWGISLLKSYGPIIFTILILVVAVEASYRIISEDRQVYTNDFYQQNTQARIERAHRIFFHLYLRGKAAHRGTSEHRHNWDKEVLSALRKYCNEDCISVYLSNTGRIQPGTDFSLLPDDKFEWASNFVWGLLERDFEHYFKI